MNFNFTKEIFRKYKYQGFWCLIFLITMLIYQLLIRFPFVAETYYFGLLFQWIRFVYDHTLGYSPVPMIYILILILLSIIFHFLKKAIKGWKVDKRMAAFTLTANLLGLICAVLSLFYWLWGFNYARPKFEDQFHLNVLQMNEDELFLELEQVTRQMQDERSLISSDTLSLSLATISPVQDFDIRKGVERFLSEISIPVFGRARIRKWYPRGILLRFSTAGVYIPHAIEGHIDPGLHPIIQPYTMTHEMFHAYGFTDEGTCELLAYLACMGNADHFIRYSGMMGYWRYLLSDCRRSDPDRYQSFIHSVSPGLISDLRAIFEYSNRYPDILPKLRNLIYDNYLKSHGVQGGLKNYSRVILLVKAWKEREGL